MKKKKKADSVPTSKHLAPVETTLFRDFMPIIEHMAMCQYEDGDSRKVGRITLTTFGGVWQAEVKDPDTLQQMRLSAQTFDDLVLLLAVQLGSEDAPWEPDTWAQQQQKKNKK